MWHWQVKKQLESFYSNNSLMCKALAGASALHVLILVLFITGTKSTKDLHITIGKSLPHCASVIVMPLVKRVADSKISQKAPIVPKKIPAQKPSSKKSTTVQAVKNIPAKKPPHTSKSPIKPVTVAKKVVPKKEPEKKLVQKEIPKKIELPVAEKPKLEAKNVAAAPTVPTIPPKQTSEQVPEPVRNEPLAVVGYEQFEEMQMQEYFEQEIARNWSPPPGFSSDTGCQVQLCISAQGVIEKIMIIKSSGSLAYDTSVRIAVGTIAVPKWAYNRSVHLHFKQL